MKLVEDDINIPKYWEHNPELKDYDGNTVAIILAKHGIIPSE